jgi:sarcosine oxidase
VKSRVSERYDVIVVGLGGMGSAALYHLAARGKRVLGLEQFTPGHDRGSSHGDSRIIRQAYFEDPAYVPLLMRTYELWRRLERESGERLLHRTGGLMIGSERSEIFAGSLRSARAYGLPHQLLTADEIRRRYPALRPAPDDRALYEEEAGVLNPEACVWAHLAGATGRGAETRFEEPVRRWAPDGDGVRVETAAGHYLAERLVVTAGPWAPRLLEQLALPLQVERQVCFWFDPGSAAPLFNPQRLPIYVWEHAGGTFFYGFPALGPEGAKVAFHHGGETTTADTVRRAVDPSDVEQMRRHLTRWVPALAAAPLTKSVTCLYTNAADGHFIIGRHPHAPQVSLMTGCSGHSYKFCAVVGEVLADLTVDGRTKHPIELFSPRRFVQV